MNSVGPERKTLPYVIAAEVRRRIIRGVYRPGDALREQSLETQLGNSRGPIREALRLLHHSGLVENIPWRGFRVRVHTLPDLEALYKARGMLEGMIIESLSETDVPAISTELQERLAQLEKAFLKKDLDAYFEANIAFHRGLTARSGIRSLDYMLDYATESTLPIRYRLMQAQFPHRSSFEAHGDIAGRIAAGDFRGARSLSEEHAIYDLDLVKRALDQSDGAE